MFCSKCGGRIPDGGGFCAYCGAKVAVNIPPAPAPVPAPAPAPIPAPAHVKIAPATQPVVQERVSWNTLFRNEWRKQFPMALFISYAVLMTLVLLIRISVFSTIGELLDYIDKANSLYGSYADEESGLLSLFVLSGRGLILANIAYCILMGIGIWWNFVQSREMDVRPIYNKPYSLMITAQLVIIIGYSVAIVSVFLFRTTYANEISDFASKEYLEEALQPYDDIMLFLVGMIVYHILGNIMLRRTRSCVENELPNGSQFAFAMAVVCFVVGGIMLLWSDPISQLFKQYGEVLDDDNILMEYSGFISAAFHVVGGVMLLLLNSRQKYVGDKYIEYNTAKTYSAKQMAQVPQYVPAWKRVQDELNEE